ncbi:MAG: alkaline shock response membrane anchor protein AmaP [Dethiobacter sp.]|jgi:uncharacterized alkaline shock family protein YloU|nr:MAG: alkaline shock response membrane anchor protein AmaP [Dethiobacter sp.]
MGTGKRIILVVLGLLALLGGLVLIFATLGVLDGTALYNLFRYTGDLRYTALGFLILLAGVILLAFSTQGGKKKEGGTIVSFTEIGEIRISFKAIENMVLTASRKIKGIREVNTRIDFIEQGLVIYMRIKVIPDVAIPGLVSELQGKVREYVQEISGASVAEIKVLVENIAQEKIEKNVR